jgi:dTDP-4-amino-4,6-dideoxygalactose transaminase
MRHQIISKIAYLKGYLYKIPWCVPAWSWAEFQVTLKCLLTGQIINGPYPQALAETLTKYLGIDYVITLNRGRTAIELALKSLDLNENDEVIIPSYICHSVQDAILRVGATPVFADIDNNLHVTPETINAVITSKTRCVIVPHLFGNVAPIDKIEAMLKDTGIALIDDAAQSFGACCSGRKISTFGSFGIISCGPGKALAGPAGGILVTNNYELYKRALAVKLPSEKSTHVAVRILSFWLWRRFRKYTLPFKMIIDKIIPYSVLIPDTGVCYMSNIDGGIALMQFQSLHINVQKRRYHASSMRNFIGDYSQYVISDFADNCMMLKLVLVIPSEVISTKKMIEELAYVGIESQKGYIPLHLKNTYYPALRITNSLWDNVLCIPIESMFRYKQILDIRS